MRFAITGVDRYVNVFKEFLNAGWEPVKLFSTPADNALSANGQMIALARQYDCDVQLTRMTTGDLRDLGECGCDALIVASYDWRIGNWSDYVRYAVNFHPSPLPIGRGPYPLVRAILDERQSWGISCHKITNEFDSGDILASENFDLHAQECHEGLNLKLQMASGRLAHHVAENFLSLWNDATAQGSGEYWPFFTTREQTINFSDSVEKILRQLRAFGTLECIAHINGKPVCVKHAIGWTEVHWHKPKSVVHVAPPCIVIAASDGYIALLDWQPIPDGLIT